MHNYSKYAEKKNEVTADMVETPAEDIVETIEEAPEVAETVYGVVCGCENLNIRSAPDATSKVNILCKVEKGSKVVVDESRSSDDWLRVCTENGIEGFCMKEYIQID